MCHGIIFCENEYLMDVLLWQLPLPRIFAIVEAFVKTLLKCLVYESSDCLAVGRK